jgi:BirA family biotin operon repressor/biotin-[acetyl-CoA-carboxylase] ligase
MVLEDSNNSLLIGSQHIRLHTVNSTNNYAFELISKSKPIDGTVISASFQDEGRGQIGRNWESEAGKNITCSVILNPEFLLARDQFQLNLAVSLAIFDFVSHFFPNKEREIKIKWPNDIYVGDEKIAGILIQNTLKGKHIKSSVMGTGININQTAFSSDIPNPTSLAALLHREIELEMAFSLLFGFLSKRYGQLSKGSVDQLRREYLDKLYRKGIKSSFKDEANHIFEGSIVGIDDFGQLLIERDDGKVHAFAFRAVQFMI